MQKPEKVMVTGGAGFIGHHVVKKLYENGYEIAVIDNLSNSRKETLAPYCSSRSDNNLVFYNTDIRNKETISHIFKHERIDSCIHLAAKISVFDSISNPNETLDVNVRGTLNVLEACSNNNVKNFVLASSAAVYGDSEILPICEENALEPLSPYGASKVAAEALVSSYNNSKIRNAISLRFFNVYGRGQTSEYAGVITRFAERLSRSLPPIIYGDGTQTRDFVFVDDVVNAILLVIGAGKKSAAASHEVFNVGKGKPTMIRDLADMMIKAFDLDLEPVFAKARASEIKHSYADVIRFKTDHGFVASEDVKSALKRIIVGEKGHF